MFRFVFPACFLVKCIVILINPHGSKVDVGVSVNIIASDINFLEHGEVLLQLIEKVICLWYREIKVFILLPLSCRLTDSLRLLSILHISYCVLLVDI